MQDLKYEEFPDHDLKPNSLGMSQCALKGYDDPEPIVNIIKEKFWR